MVRLQTVIDATIKVPLSPSSFVTFSTSLTWAAIPAYITSVFIGYIGTDSIGPYLSNASLLKKAGVEDGRNQ